MRKALMAGIGGAVLLQAAAAWAVPATGAKTGASAGVTTGNAAAGRINNRLALGLANAKPPVECAAGQTCAPGGVEAGGVEAGGVTSGGASHFPFAFVLGGVAAAGGIAAVISSGGHGNPVSP